MSDNYIVPLSEAENEQDEIIHIPSAVMPSGNSNTTTVTTANNNALPAKTWLVAFIFAFTFAGFVMTMLIVAGLNLYLALAAFVVVITVTVRMFLDALSGDRVAREEIKRKGKTEEKYITARSKEVDLYYNNQSQKNQLEALRIDSHYRLENRRLDLAQADQSLTNRVAMLESNISRLGDEKGVDTNITKGVNFVPAYDSQGRKEALKWLNGLISQSNGKLPSLAQISAPWNGAWKGKEWSNEGKLFLTNNFIYFDKGMYRWKVETIEELINRMNYL